MKQNLAEVSHQYAHLLPPLAIQSLGKLQRGENYDGRPWRALDYPAVLSSTDLFTFRAVLIWGRHISFNFILQGQYFTPQAAQSLLSHLHSFPNLKLWTHPELWKWEIDSPFCVPVNANTQLPDLPFFRILISLPLEQVADIPNIGTEFWSKILEGLALTHS